jgi:hypothetical protein
MMEDSGHQIRNDDGNEDKNQRLLALELAIVITNLTIIINAIINWYRWSH